MEQQQSAAALNHRNVQIVTRKTQRAVEEIRRRGVAGTLTALLSAPALLLTPSNGWSGHDFNDESIPVNMAASQNKGFWGKLSPFRGKTRTNGESGKKRRYFEKDLTHGDIEVYDSKGDHLGSANPETGEMTKGPVKGRKIDL